MRILVTGAGGFIGKNLVRVLGCSGVTHKDLDLTDCEATSKYFEKHEKFDVVIHCATVGGSRLKEDPESVVHHNVSMFDNLQLNRNKFDTLVHFSSGAAFSASSTPYGKSKLIIDHKIDKLPDTYSLRIWGCYGPGEPETRFTYACRSGHVTIDKDRLFDFVNVEFVIKVVKDLIYNPGRYPKFLNLVDKKEPLLLSDWAKHFGASFTLVRKDVLDEPYHCIRGDIHPSPFNSTSLNLFADDWI
jgi:nucleoside-diphosphate-sugar epimerase